MRVLDWVKQIVDVFSSPIPQRFVEHCAGTGSTLKIEEVPAQHPLKQNLFIVL